MGVQVLGAETRFVLAEAGESGLTVIQTGAVRAGDGLARAMRSLPRRPSAVVCAVPLTQAAIRILSLPPTTDENLERVVALEAETALPMGTEDMAISHHMLGMTEQSRMEVLLAAARQEAVQFSLKTVNCAPWISAQATLTGIALMNAVQALRGSSRENAYAILNIELDGSELLVVDRSRVLVAQFLPTRLDEEAELAIEEPVAVAVGGESVGGTPSVLRTAAYPWVEQIAQQVRYAIQAVAYERALNIERLYVCGGGANRPNVDWQFSEALDLPVTVVAPETGGAGPSYAVAFGCAVQAAGEAHIALNLTPPRVTIAREVEQRRQSTLSWGALAGAGAVALALVFGAAVHQKNQELAAAKAKLEELKPYRAPASSPKELKAAETAVDAGLKVRVSPATLMKTLSERLPVGTWLSELSYTSQQGAVLRGASTDSTGAQRAHIEILQANLFDTPVLNYVNQEEIEGVTVWGFQITCKLKQEDTRRRRTRGATSR
jgi:Tfp pilus assembly PilM family ATPase